MEELRHPWKPDNNNWYDIENWYIVNVETGKKKKIGRVGAKRTNYYDVACQEAHRRNLKLQEKGSK